MHATWGATRYASLITLPDESSQAQTLEAEASTSTATAVRAILLFVPSKLPRTTKQGTTDMIRHSLGQLRCE